MGSRFAFEYNDIDSFRKQIGRVAIMVILTKDGIHVVTEGVFGMRGEQEIRKEIIEQRQYYDFRFLVDDAHGFWTLGDSGVGTGEE